MFNEIERKFNEAVIFMNNYNNLDTLSPDDKLSLYKYFKQSMFGDCNMSKPYFFETVKYKKWEAWNSINGMSKETAMSNYRHMVEFIKMKN